jgi:hypothetical protein
MKGCPPWDLSVKADPYCLKINIEGLRETTVYSSPYPNRVKLDLKYSYCPQITS